MDIDNSNLKFKFNFDNSNLNPILITLIIWPISLHRAFLIRVLTNNFLLNYFNFDDARKHIHDMSLII